MSRFKFFDEEKDNDQLLHVAQNENNKIKTDQQKVSVKRYRYRVEQLMITKFNGQIINHGTTKQEFVVQKNFLDENLKSLQFELVENVIKFEPPQLQTAISLLCDFDIIKSNIELGFDAKTGRLNQVLNKEGVLNAWEDYKKATIKAYSFVKSTESQQNIQLFINKAEEQINNDSLLLSDFETKLFFDIIFDRYLVQEEGDLAYDKEFISNLFDYRKINIHIGQFIIMESSELIKMKRTGTLDQRSIDKDFMVKQYDEKFKPYVGFSFSSYNYTYNQNFTINKEENVISEANIVLVEEIKNNVQITVNYDLKLVEL
ncbi:hypothetical protein [uncultured Pedobacter sp.]|uniref:hypothetical protein n=1 Tax=uncultured Pedobacter sp. TaxID=246139 RepID=UPI0025E7B0AD|nr:hypothetical protein [uncultured Pedobacter sp.]